MRKEDQIPPGEGRLDGASIVVTRPAERGESLCRAITAIGGDALLFPTLEILPVDDATLPEDLTMPDWLVFTSVPSVAHGVILLDRELPAWRNAKIAAIGYATAEALRDKGIREIVLPPEGRQQSEGLLESHEFSVARGDQVLIVRGEGGRRAIDEELQQRGAIIRSIAVYRREVAATDPAPLLARWREDRIDAIVISSADGLRALHACLDDNGRKALRDTQLVLPTTRVIKLAQELGILPEPLVAAGASDDAMLEALVEWWNRKRQ